MVRADYQRYLDTRYFSSLDGLRCLSIVPVIWHHATPRPLSGFFGKGRLESISFLHQRLLITTLLLREKASSGQIALVPAPIGLGAILALALDSRRGFSLLSRVLAHSQSAPLALSGLTALLLWDANHRRGEFRDRAVTHAGPGLRARHGAPARLAGILR